MFIVKEDFYTVYTEESFDLLIANDDSIWEKQLPRTLEDIKGYLRARYDVESIFADIQTFDITATYNKRDRILWEEDAYISTSTYNTGDLVSYSGSIYQADEDGITGDFDDTKWTLLGTNRDLYTCTAESTGNLPSDTAYFSNTDDRNQKIVEITVDIIVYNLVTRLNNRDIPNIRIERYDGNRNNVKMGAMGWLNDVNKGVLQPDLPLRVEGELDGTGNIIIDGDAKQVKAKNSAF